MASKVSLKFGLDAPRTPFKTPAFRAIFAGFAVVVVAASALLGLTGCSKNGDNLPASSSEEASLTGITEYKGNNRPGPIEWSSTTDTGNKVSNQTYKGKVLVLNFWYAACGPCRGEAPDLAKVSGEFIPQGVQFLGVNVRDSADTAKAFERNFGIPYQSVLDATSSGPGVQTQFAAAGVPPKAVPTTVIIDKDGRITARILGPVSPSSLKTLIKTAMSESN